MFSIMRDLRDQSFTVM